MTRVETSAQELESYVALAKDQLATTHARIQRLAEANADVAKLASADDVPTVTGQVTTATAFIYGTVSADLTFTTFGNRRLKFYAEQWGLGLGGGTSWGGGVFAVSPDALLAMQTSGFAMHSEAIGGGQLNITWFNGDTLLGTFWGAALAFNLSITGGSGKWSQA